MLTNLALLTVTLAAWSSAARTTGLLLVARRTVGAVRILPGTEQRDPVCVLVPCYNEELVLGKTLDAIFASEGVNLASVICIDDGSTDESHAVMRTAQGDHGDKLVVLRQPNGGKATALNAGLAAVDSRFFVAIDADTRVMPHTIAALLSRLHEPGRVAAVSGHMLVGNRSPASTAVYSAQTREYERANNLDRRAFSAADLISVVPGAVGAFETDAVRNVGGYPLGTLAEDAHLTFELLLSGRKIVHEPAADVLTEAPETFAGLLTQRVRWATGKLQVLRRTAPRALRASTPVRLLWLDTAVQEALAPIAGVLLVAAAPLLLVTIAAAAAEGEATTAQMWLAALCALAIAQQIALWWISVRFARAADAPSRRALDLRPATWSPWSLLALPVARSVAGWRAWATVVTGAEPRWNKLPRSGDVVGVEEAQLAGPGAAAPGARHPHQDSPVEIPPGLPRRTPYREHEEHHARDRRPRRFLGRELRSRARRQGNHL